MGTVEGYVLGKGRRVWEENRCQTGKKVHKATKRQELTIHNVSNEKCTDNHRILKKQHSLYATLHTLPKNSGFHMGPFAHPFARYRLVQHFFTVPERTAADRALW
jgi:hypothetical protein